MLTNRKQAVSIRMAAADVRKVKQLAARLGVRDSDMIRYAVKSMLGQLAPLHDPHVRGRNLIPVFVESGSELLRHFELDANRLESIINDGVGSEQRVASDDIALIAMTAQRPNYAPLNLAPPGREGADPSAVRQTLRHYLYDKYAYRSGDPDAMPAPRSGRNGEIDHGA